MFNSQKNDHVKISLSGGHVTKSHHTDESGPCGRVPPWLRVPATVMFYMATSFTLVIVNKSVLNNAVKLPISLLFFQTLVCVVLIWSLAYMKVVQAPTSFVGSKCRQLLPLICGNVAVLCLNTFCLQSVDASVFQIARGATVPCTMLAQYILNGKTSSPLTVVAAGIIVSGFVSGLFDRSSDREGDENMRWGMFFGFLSSVGAAANACYAAIGVETMEGNTVHLVFYNQSMLLCALVPVWLLSGEANDLYALLLNPEEGPSFMTSICITGVFAFLINLAGFLQIKMTSPATHIVSGAARGVLQTVLAVIILKERVSTIRIIGTCIIICGTSLYTYSKSLHK